MLKKLDDLNGDTAPINTTLTDAAESSTLPATTSTAVTTLLQTIRNNIKYLLNNLFTKTETINAVYPVGSIYMSVNNTNPGTYLTDTTWVALGSGRVPVGVDSSDTAFNSVEKTGGAKTHALSTDEMPNHSHSLSGNFSFSGNTGAQSAKHKHNWYGDKSKGSQEDSAYNAGNNGVSKYRGYMTDEETTNHTHSFLGSITLSGNTGGNGSSYPHNNLQPYITCYMWKRTA